MGFQGVLGSKGSGFLGFTGSRVHWFENRVVWNV
jgi:hypothetical protein